MSALGNVYFTKARLQELANLAEKRISLSFSINDDTNQYGQNVSFFISQTKDEREAKEKKNYVGNGSVVWTDGTIKVADKVERKSESGLSKDEKVNELLTDDDGLGF